MRKWFWISFSFCLLLLFPFSGQAQEIQLKGRFLADSLKIGEPVFYSFSVRYPRNLNILLPDSTFNFSPFEFLDKTYYPTQSDSLYSTDSVVYTLASYELENIQQLRMPAYLVQGRDSSALWTIPDSVRILEMIPALTDSTAFVENTTYMPVEKEFNYLYAIVGGLLAIGLCTALVIAFSAPIKRQYKIYKLKRSFHKYEKEYKEALASYEAREGTVRPENLLGIWKSYMEQLEKVPYTKLTTKEISSLRRNGTDLNRILRPIDRGIYGTMSDNRMTQSFQELYQVANHSYHNKVKEVRHA